ncbi:MAG: FAD-dependent oxidoreductase [Dysgonomonas sp.]
MNQSTYDCIVIGGGISGISFAHYLKKAGKKDLIVAKNNRIGGQIQTEHSSVNPDYWFEMGSHTCYNSYTSLLSIVDETGNNELIQPLQKHSFVLYSSGKIKSLFSGVSKLPMILCFFKYFFADKTGKTTREYFRPLVGAKNYDKLFRNAFKAVICQPADDYPAEIFLKKRKERYKEHPRRVTFKNGLSSILKTVVEKENIEVQLSSEIINIRKAEDTFSLETKDGKIFQARNIALASSPRISSSLLKDTEAELSELLFTIPLFQSESLNIVIPKEKLALKEIAGIISLSDDFLSAVSRDLISDEQLRSFTFHFEKGKRNKEETIKLICEVLGVSPTDIVEQTYTEHTLPAMRLQHLQMEEKVNEKRKNDSIYLLGNYFYGLSLEDCVNRSKMEAERFLSTDQN